MAQINVILWDVDGTLLDFSAAERRALEDCFRSFQMGPCTPELLARYSQINRTYWRRLERGELTKPQVLLGRFEEFFAQEGLNCRDIPAFNQEYQLRLGDTVVFRDDAGSLVARLKGRVRQYAVTNGTRVAQERKLSRSGLDRMLDGVFISEIVGTEKPGAAFFDAVFSQIGPWLPGRGDDRGRLPHQRHAGGTQRRHPVLLVQPSGGAPPGRPPHRL